MTDQLSETENGGGAVMVDVEELQGLLLEEQKHSIDQFGVFRQVSQLPLAIPFQGVT
jgi:hypothetical protein